MHRLLCRVFKERLDWDVQITDDMEMDKYDGMDPVYLLQRGSTEGCKVVFGSCNQLVIPPILSSSIHTTPPLICVPYLMA